MSANELGYIKSKPTVYQWGDLLITSSMMYQALIDLICFYYFRSEWDSFILNSRSVGVLAFMYHAGFLFCYKKMYQNVFYSYDLPF